MEGPVETRDKMKELPAYKSWGIGQRLAEARAISSMSLADLRDATGISDGLLSKYERGIVNPSWTQIERILSGLGQIPCVLFPDICRARGEKDDTFKVQYYEAVPQDEKHVEPPTLVEFRRHSPLIRLLGIGATDERYRIIRAKTDMMAPLWYPGDLLVFDNTLEPRVDRIIDGFYKGEPMVARLIRQKSKLYLAPSNRYYPMRPYNEKAWNHFGVLIYALRDMSVRPTPADERGN